MVRGFATPRTGNDVSRGILNAFKADNTAMGRLC